MLKEVKNGKDTNNKIKIENLLNPSIDLPSTELEESIEDSRKEPLDPEFLRDFLKTDSNRSSPVNFKESSSPSLSSPHPSSSPSNSSISQDSRLSFDSSRSPS